MRGQSLGLACAMALVTSATAQAATLAPEKPCVTADELKGLTAFALPSVVDHVVKKCASTLRSNGYFNSRGIELVQKLSAGKEAGWPLASQAFRKMGGFTKGKSALDLSDATLRVLIENEMIPSLLKEVPPAMCRDIESVVETLDPLPAPNMVQFIAAIFTVAGRNGSELRACPAG